MTLLKSSFAVTMSAVLVLTSPKYSTWSLPTVQRMRCGLVFSGRWAQTMRRYVACLPFGIAETGMKNMVLVPGIVSLPWARRWISVALADRQRSPSELWLSSLYSASSPVSGLKAFPWSAMKWMHRWWEVVWVAWRARNHAEQCGRRWEHRGGVVLIAVGGTGRWQVRLSVRMVAFSGVAISGTLRAGVAVDGSCTLRDAAGLGIANLLTGALWGCALSGRAGIGGKRGASEGWLGLLVPWRTSMSSLRASAWLSIRGASGEFGNGFCKAWRMSVMPALT